MSKDATGDTALRMHELQPGEAIQHSWVAGVPMSQQDNFRGRLSKYGGKLILTNRRLLFEPLKVVTPTGGGGFGLEFLTAGKAFELGEITGVEPFSSKAPARLKLTLSGGGEVVLGVLKSRTATIWSKDTSARDEAVGAISAAAAL
jgi:hypothetical protein